MKESLNFLIETHKLKKMPRTGWVLRGVENPETIGEHIFRVAFLSWLLADKKKLNTKEAIKIALSHDLCEVYAGDVTPFFYYLNLPKDQEKKKKLLMKWVRLSRKEKEKRGKKKLEMEKKAFLRLLKPLDQKTKQELFSAWFNYEKGVTYTGKFVKQLDKIETLIQAIEYFGPGKTPAMGWWEETEELIEDPLLLDFLKVIQKRFYGKKIAKIKDQKELESVLDFILEIGKLKRLPRLYWNLRGVKNPESVAEHIFTLLLMAWVFGKEKKNLHMNKLLKMAICHELSAVYTGDTTPYDRILPADNQQREEVLKKMLRLSKKEKKWIFFADYREEKKAIEKLTKKLRPSLKKEILLLWREYRTKSSPEGYFLAQLNALAVLLQGILYEKEDKKFFVSPIWEWTFEFCDDPVAVELMEEIKKKFY